MEIILKITAGGIISAVLAATLRGHNRELSAAFSILACAVLSLSGISMFRTAFSYLHSLRELAGIDRALLMPVLSVCGIGVLTHFGTLFCQEAGEGAIGKIVFLCGNVAAVCACLPLLDAVQTVIREFLK